MWDSIFYSLQVKSKNVQNIPLVPLQYIYRNWSKIQIKSKLKFGQSSTKQNMGHVILNLYGISIQIQTKFWIAFELYSKTNTWFNPKLYPQIGSGIKLKSYFKFKPKLG